MFTPSTSQKLVPVDVDPGTGDKVLTPIELTVSVDDFVDAGNTDVEVK